jgi:xanthine/CO dehydrogenase XdhC/CoxF family maturation factor
LEKQPESAGFPNAVAENIVGTHIDGWIQGSTAMLTRTDDILKAAEDWRAAGRGVALATVVETWGSAPRPVGSNLVIDDQGNFLGSVSGGCVEGAVVSEAIDVIESGKPKTLEFGVADETAWKVGLSCGGKIRVYVEKVD